MSLCVCNKQKCPNTLITIIKHNHRSTITVITYNNNNNNDVITAAVVYMHLLRIIRGQLYHLITPPPPSLASQNHRHIYLQDSTSTLWGIIIKNNNVDVTYKDTHTHDLSLHGQTGMMWTALPRLQTHAQNAGWMAKYSRVL